MTEPVEVGHTTVTNALVDWNVNCSNTPDLYVGFEDHLDADSIIAGGEVHSVYNDTEEKYIAETNGALFGFEVGPFDSPERRPILSVNLCGDVVDGVYMYDHVVHRTCARNNQLPDTMTIQTIDSGCSTPVLTIEKAKEIVSTYINGDMGTDENRYWVHRRDRSDWNRAVSDREDFEPYADVSTVIVDDRYPYPQQLDEADLHRVV